MAKNKQKQPDKEAADNAVLTTEDKNAIVAQAIKEIAFDRRYKQGKIKNWQKNENQYYGVKPVVLESRANIELGRMQEFVHTLLSKIRNPLIFKYKKGKNSQLKRAQLLNGVRTFDQNHNYWNMKDLVGKKQAIIYGRAIYCYYADSADDKYHANLDNTDVYDFLIDPDAGGLDIENALNLGRYGVVKTKEDLLDDPDYDQDVVKILTSDGATGNNTEKTQEETNKLNRMYGQNTVGQKANSVNSDSKYKFWEWYTTWYNPRTKTDDRYYLLMQERAGKAVRVCRLDELFKSNLWPFWSWAAFPDLTEFWTPSYCDYAREIFQAQNVSVNQGFDNSEAINKPQKLVNVGAIENMAELKYRRDGIIKTKGDYDAARAIQIIRPPAIDTPLKMFDLLENIMGKMMGVNDQTRGIEDPDGNGTIYEGNQEAQADRFGLLNSSYSFGYEKFAILHQNGVKEHLTQKMSVEINGPEGIENEDIDKDDIFKEGDESFGVIVEASDAEERASKQSQDIKLGFLKDAMTEQNQPNAPKIVNPKKAFEVRAKIVGLGEESIKELMDMTEYGSEELMSEADEDIEALLRGDKIQPNSGANNAYKQRLVDYLSDHMVDMQPDQFNLIRDYIVAIGPIVISNEQRALNQHLINTVSQPPTGMDGSTPAPGAPAEAPAAPQLNPEGAPANVGQ